MKGWIANRISKQNELRKNLVRCERCDSLYGMDLKQCPYCSGLSNLELQRQLDKRASFRIGLGKLMFLAALVIIIMMVFAL